MVSPEAPVDSHVRGMEWLLPHIHWGNAEWFPPGVKDQHTTQSVILLAASECLTHIGDLLANQESKNKKYSRSHPEWADCLALAVLHVSLAQRDTARKAYEDAIGHLRTAWGIMLREARALPVAPCGLDRWDDGERTAPIDCPPTHRETAASVRVFIPKHIEVTPVPAEIVVQDNIASAFLALTRHP